MKMRALRAVLAASAAGCAAAANLRQAIMGVENAVPDEQSKLLQVEVSAEAELIANEVLSEKLDLQQAMKNIHDKMTVEDAVRRLNGKLSEDVMSLVKEGTSQAPKLDEKSIKKARLILNKMIEDSIAELDAVIIECKAFENMNRVTFGQVTTDLNRLGSEMAEAEEKIAENQNCMAAQDKERKSVTATLTKERSAYEKERSEDDAELTIKKNDLAVFNFIMKLTQCKKSAALLQEEPVSSLRVCGSEEGYELESQDPGLQEQLGKLMTPEARRALDSALGMAFSSKIQDATFLQEEAENVATTKSKITTTVGNKATKKPTRTKDQPPKSVAWKKCVDGKPNCGLLHDTMSLQWGKFKDLVDELEAEMAKKKDAWDALREDLNEQLDVIATRKGECQTGFDVAVGTKNMVQTETDEKTVQARELTVEYEKHMATCKARIEEILFTNVCAVKKVRNEVCKSSSVSPPSKIVDCEVSNWVGEQCSVRCDNSCPHRVGGQIDPFSCGGKKTLRRRITVKANKFGLKCPSLRARTRCGQYKCPVDCVMSRWSRWSKCTKDCGGGTRQKTRSILRKPKNGGKFCDSPIDAEACNTGSCDRNCKLDRWSRWSPCSMACNPGGMPGFTIKRKKVLVPIRGNGYCPSSKSYRRYRRRLCNQQACYGDEICVARQDLIIAIDGSGSLKESGFKIVRDFAANLTGNYRSRFWQNDKAHLGVILFGNGVLADDGTTSPATNVIGLTADLKKVKKAILKTKWQKGYTNMAQAFILADTMFQQGGRAGAQSALLVMSDGKYSFAFETEQAVNKLKEKGTMVYMAPIAEREGEWKHKLKTWASQPWQTNYELLPGLEAVKNGMETYSKRLVSKFCPKAVSPTLLKHAANRRGYMLLRQQAFMDWRCGKYRGFWWIRGGPRRCFRLTRRFFPKWNGMMMSRWRYRFWGRRFCLAQNPKGLDGDMWYKMLSDRSAFKCKSGKFWWTPFLNVYALKPVR